MNKKLGVAAVVVLSLAFVASCGKRNSAANRTGVSKGGNSPVDSDLVLTPAVTTTTPGGSNPRYLISDYQLVQKNKLTSANKSEVRVYNQLRLVYTNDTSVTPPKKTYSFYSHTYLTCSDGPLGKTKLLIAYQKLTGAGNKEKDGTSTLANLGKLSITPRNKSSPMYATLSPTAATSTGSYKLFFRQSSISPLDLENETPQVDSRVKKGSTDITDLLTALSKDDPCSGVTASAPADVVPDDVSTGTTSGGTAITGQELGETKDDPDTGVEPASKPLSLDEGDSPETPEKP